MNPLGSVTVAIAVFGGMLLCHELGHRLGRHLRPANPPLPGSAGVMEGAVFALLGLLLGFTFAGASSRLDARRRMVVDEANAIGTAYLRLDALSSGNPGDLRELFRPYVEARRRVYDSLPDLAAANREYVRAVEIQQQIWRRAVEATRGDLAGQLLVLPAINDMIDLSSTRSILSAFHVPAPVLLLLVLVALLSALLAGFGTPVCHPHARVQTVLYAVVIALTVYVVLDAEYPRSGLITVGLADDALRLLQESIPR